MRISHIVIYFSIIMVPVSGQWISFDLSEANSNIFLKQTEPIVRSSVLALGQPTLMDLSETKRFGIAISFPLGWDVTNTSIQTNPHVFLPMAEGQILVTNNLVLKGKMNLLSPQGESVNAAGYGMEYYEQTWAASVSMGWLEGPSHLRVRMIDFSLLWRRTLSEIPINFGIGHNNYRASFRNFDDEKIPSNRENSLTYFILGTQYHLKMFDINLQTQIHYKFIQFNLQLLRSFF